MKIQSFPKLLGHLLEKNPFIAASVFGYLNDDYTRQIFKNGPSKIVSMFVSGWKWQSGIKDDPLPSPAVLWIVSVCVWKKPLIVQKTKQKTNSYKICLMEKIKCKIFRPTINSQSSNPS